MNFIKKIFDDKIDESVHLQFQKFSKGEFTNRALVKAKNSGSKYSITTTAEFANELVRDVAEKLGNLKTKVTGAIISTSDFTGIIDFKEKKQFQGVKKYVIEKEMSGNEIINLLEKFPKAFFALSFEVEKDETKLKIKPKQPKSGKPSSKEDEKPVPDFCRLSTKDQKIGQSFVFEKPNFKEAEIDHVFLITDLVVPKDEKDFAKMREMAKRKGTIIRNSKIDGKEIKTEKDFAA
jgi:hypothetical protein